LEPAMAYVDKLQFDPQKTRHIKKFFIRCTRSELAPFIHTSLKNINSDPEQWTTFELEAGHVCQPTAPDELASILLQIDDL
ncbi:MAG: hypothetical protein LLF83_03495, partial [Methanobacterium sp.]|nr:hypothetical protein [Methanobacterium sp.]